MMRTKIFILLLAIMPLASCNDWLTVTPKGEAEAEDLLSNYSGYNKALSGIYYMLSSEELYGGELTYGLMDILGQYWDVSLILSHRYHEASKYNYTDQRTIGMIDKIWHKMYMCIAQCNLILESLEHNRSEITNSELIEGEAYALRAFCHMELFRLFGPVIRTESDLDKPAISYRREFNVTAQRFESGRSVLTKVKEDLNDALGLLMEDPIKTSNRYSDLNTSLMVYHDVLNYRGARMNYFGALGMLARAEQLLLKPDQALVYAERIIREIEENESGGRIRLLERSDMSNSDGRYNDRIFSMEMLFSLYRNDLYTAIEEVFPIDYAHHSGSKSLMIDDNLFSVYVNDVYQRGEGHGSDSRLKNWFDQGSYCGFSKMTESANPGFTKLPYDPEISLMRMSEVYYIAIESLIGVNNIKAVQYLNKVRESRNLEPLQNATYTDSELLEQLLAEQRKDFVGEGRIFLLHKRLNHEMYVSSRLTIQPSETIFVFPIPDAEYEYSPNEKPTN